MHQFQLLVTFSRSFLRRYSTQTWRLSNQSLTNEDLVDMFTTPDGFPRVKGRPFLIASDKQNMPDYVKPSRSDFPIIFTPSDFPKASGRSVQSLATALRPFLDEKVRIHPAIVLRGLELRVQEDFEEFFNSLGYKPKSYLGGSATRDLIGKNIVPASTEPGPLSIEPHNEMAYWNEWPDYIFMFCEAPPAQGCGGECLLAENRAIQANLDPAITEQLRTKGIRYHRYLTVEERLTFPAISKVFQTNNKAEIEEILTERKQSFIWHDDGTLTFWYNQPVYRTHPLTGEEIFFNQMLYDADYFRYHPFWQDMFDVPDDKMPFHTYYSDGSEIPGEVMQAIRSTVWQNTIYLRLQPGDLVMIDNMLVQHGRLGFVGKRRQFVSMACR